MSSCPTRLGPGSGATDVRLSDAFLALGTRASADWGFSDARLIVRGADQGPGLAGSEADGGWRTAHSGPAFGLVLALTVAITLGIAAWGTSEARTTINGLLPVLLSIELTLLSAAAAVYFAGGDPKPRA